MKHLTSMMIYGGLGTVVFNAINIISLNNTGPLAFLSPSIVILSFLTGALIIFLADILYRQLGPIFSISSPVKRSTRKWFSSTIKNDIKIEPNKKLVESITNK